MQHTEQTISRKGETVMSPVLRDVLNSNQDVLRHEQMSSEETLQASGLMPGNDTQVSSAIGQSLTKPADVVSGPAVTPTVANGLTGDRATPAGGANDAGSAMSARIASDNANAASHATRSGSGSNGDNGTAGLPASASSSSSGSNG